ncbi:MAG TPA: 2OG-Fe(II) oxygenase [Gammaproteobacteria bacterium]|nr:2OG-Fe(II) oxygenase [Gammaproteobacteria bacterium]
MLINIDNIYKTKANSAPYQNAIVKDVINLDNVIKLIKTLPTASFKYVSRQTGSDKTYKVHNNIIYSLSDQATNQGLPDIWLKLVNELTSHIYREAITDLMGYNVNNSFIEITLKQYRLGDYISPHTDRDSVPVTHVVFLNPHWENHWGGEFCILASESQIVEEIKPIWNNSIVFKQSEKSWHSVNPCKSPLINRVGLQIAFWITQDKIIQPGRHEHTYEA